MDAVAKTIEPAVAQIRERLAACARGAHDPAEATAELLSILDAMKRFLDIFRPPEYKTGDPGPWLKQHAPTLENQRCSITAESAQPCVFDPDQVLACVSTLIENAELYEDAVLLAELLDEDDLPRIALNFDGPGAFPKRLRVGGLFPLALDTLCVRWTVATRGGRIQRSPSGLELRLKGMREPDESDARVMPLLEGLQKLEHAVKACARALDSGSDPAPAIAEALEETERYLILLDGGEQKPEPGDLRRTIEEAIAVHAAEAAERAIEVIFFSETAIPPLLMTRTVLVRVWEAVLQHAFRVLPRGGSVSLMLGYLREANEAVVMIGVEGGQCSHDETMYCASIRRGIEALHQGEVEMAPEKNGLLLNLKISDRVAKALDAWLPGWRAFSEQSRQMLRLLKSGGEAPPEDFILGGILENELERWLLPLLTEPAAVNVAHDGVAALEGLPGASSERLDKALAQIKRGKPKKEIVRPPYAGELLWVFRAPERARKALRLDRLDEEALRDLCEGLLQTPADSLRCLRHVARVVEELRT